MPDRRGRRPALTEEGRENQLVSLAIDLAERQLAEGTASSQVITHYLKLGSTREKLEQERLRNENELLMAKVEALASAERMEELYGKALNAMRAYSGEDVEETYDEDGEYYYDEDVR
jgi:ribosomal 30S subunit maturation factor RimM